MLSGIFFFCLSKTIICFHLTGIHFHNECQFPFEPPFSDTIFYLDFFVCTWINMTSRLQFSVIDFYSSDPIF